MPRPPKPKPKTPNGGGSITHRPDGRYEVRVTLPDGRRLSRYADTPTSASVLLRGLLADVDKGRYIDGPAQTVERFVTTWLNDVARHTVRESTFASYQDVVRLHIIPPIGAVKLGKLSPQHLQRLYSAKLASGLSPRSVQLIHAIVRRSLKQAERWGFVERNVATLVDPPRVTRHEITPFDTQQIGRMLDAARGHRHEALYVIAIAAGLREGELLGLRWRDVDLDQGILSVVQQARPMKGRGVVFTEPKTAKGRRSIALPAFAVTALRMHRKRQAEARLLAGAEWHDLDLVFPTIIGTPMLAGNLLMRSFYPLLERAGLPKIRFHDLRHSAATLLLSEGIHPRVVQERLGHSSIGVTMDTYSHVLPNLQREAAERIEGALASRLASDSSDPDEVHPAVKNLRPNG